MTTNLWRWHVEHLGIRCHGGARRDRNGVPLLRHWRVHVLLPPTRTRTRSTHLILLPTHRRRHHLLITRVRLRNALVEVRARTVRGGRLATRVRPVAHDRVLGHLHRCHRRRDALRRVLGHWRLHRRGGRRHGWLVLTHGC